VLGVANLGAGLGGIGIVWIARKIGRRGALALSGALMAAAGLGFALASSFPLLLLAGATGMTGGASLNFGPYYPVEQSIVAESVPPQQRNRAFGRYELIGGAAAAAGSGIASWGDTAFHREVLFLVFAAIGLVTSVLAAGLDSATDTQMTRPRIAMSRVSLKLTSLFALDAAGGGFIIPSLIAYWFHLRFGMGANEIGPIFLASSLLQTASYEVAWRLGNRIGLVNTMVWTHLPAQVFIFAMPFAPNAGVAIALFMGNSMLSSMDVPARQAYVSAVVPPEMRDATIGVTGGVRGLSQSVTAEAWGGAVRLFGANSPFFAASALKTLYLALLYRSFRHMPAEHERQNRAPAPVGPRSALGGATDS
jgi:MFS family permease